MKTDGAPVCWGLDEFGQASVPDGLGTVGSISAGYGHTCAVKTDGTPVCWGLNDDGQSSVPEPPGTVGPLLPFMTSPPSVSGNPRTGQVLTADPGEWSQPVTSIEVEWLRCTNKELSSCVRIESADADDLDVTYTLVDADDAMRIRARVTPYNTAGPGQWSVSAPTVRIDKPTLLTRPAVSGALRTGETLSTDNGEWTGDPASYTIEWLRCSTLYLNGCTKITTGDATDNDTTYTLINADDAKRIRSRVTARNLAGAGPATTSKPTALVDKPTLLTRPAMTGALRTGQSADHRSRGVDGRARPPTRSNGCAAAPCTSTAARRSPPPTRPTTTPPTRSTDADDAKRIRSRVTARNLAGAGPATTSKPTALVDKPTLLTRPALTGAPIAGQPLSTDHGDWTGDPTAYTIEWLRCSTFYLNSCTKITTADATDNDLTYTPTGADEGLRIRSRVQAHNPSGASTKETSLYTKKIAPPPATLD